MPNVSSNGRPRILLITRNLPPLVGGMERLNWHIADELAKIADVRIIGPEGSRADAPRGVEVREVPLWPLWRFLLRARALAHREAHNWRPDVVLAGSGLTAPLALSTARACGARAVVYAHGLDVAVQHPVYRMFWLPAIRRMDRIIANSHATAEFCSGIGVDAARIGIVHPGVNSPDRAENGQADALRARHELGAGPLLLSVGRLTTRKGLREFVVQALPCIAAVYPDVKLVIVGDAPAQALYAQAQSPASIQAAADAVGVGRCLKFFGVITDFAELSGIYYACDVHVFPVREIPGDPEGFGMVAVEAAAHGLPTVAFATGGVVDAVTEGKSGHLVPPGDYATFADSVILTLTERDSLRGSSVEFAQNFVWPEFGFRIVEELQRPHPSAEASFSK
jgi:phosphatidylinositol alpha-1,6-mannosyltransferase